MLIFGLFGLFGIFGILGIFGIFGIFGTSAVWLCRCEAPAAQNDRVAKRERWSVLSALTQSGPHMVVVQLPGGASSRWQHVSPPWCRFRQFLDPATLMESRPESYGSVSTLWFDDTCPCQPLPSGVDRLGYGSGIRLGVLVWRCGGYL